MDALQVLAPLLGVVLGSALTGVGAYLKARGERKKVVAIALADLLEVRHQVVRVQTSIRELVSRLGVPPEVMPSFRNFIDAISPADSALHDRYDNAVSIIAGIDPVLAFSLRSKNTLPKLLSFVRNYAIKSGTDLAAYDQLEETLVVAVIPGLDDAVQELANHHSWRTSLKVRAILEQKSEIPVEFQTVIDLLKRQAESQSNTENETDA